MAVCPLCGCKTDELDFVLCKIEDTEAKVCSFCDKQINKINTDEKQASAQLRWILPLDFTFTGGFVFQQNTSTKGLYRDNIYLCDLFIGKRFLKSRRLEFNIGVNDLLNSSLHSYWHTVNATGKSDGKNIGIGRYFSLQCIWNFRAGTRPKKIIK